VQKKSVPFVASLKPESNPHAVEAPLYIKTLSDDDSPGIQDPQMDQQQLIKQAVTKAE
jgi:hypothetical protein